MITPANTGKVVGIIPARWQSSRFPGKPLHDIAGKPMIQHVWERCQASETLEAVLIATDDERIAQTATAFGAQVKMTSETHLSGTDGSLKQSPMKTNLVTLSTSREMNH